jgi:hypothetical protein
MDDSHASVTDLAEDAKVAKLVDGRGMGLGG